jgi:hypothetical protein
MAVADAVATQTNAKYQTVLDRIDSLLETTTRFQLLNDELQFTGNR